MVTRPVPPCKILAAQYRSSSNISNSNSLRECHGQSGAGGKRVGISIINVAPGPKGCETGWEIGRAPYFLRLKLDVERPCGIGDRLQPLGPAGRRILHQAEASSCGYDFLQDIEPFRIELGDEQADPVMFPPGLAKLAISPKATRSLLVATIGIVRVAR
jgi:hypothetical protein